MQYALDTASIKTSLDVLALKHERIARALAQVGYPEERRREHSFATLARIVVGQQISVSAAASVTTKLLASLGGDLTAEAVLRADETTLRSAGLSRQKVEYMRCLATAEATHVLSLEALPSLSDDEAIRAITQIKGFGDWSAQMYLMFSLGRPNIWRSVTWLCARGLSVFMGSKRARPLDSSVRLASRISRIEVHWPCCAGASVPRSLCD